MVVTVGAGGGEGFDTGGNGLEGIFSPDDVFRDVSHVEKAMVDTAESRIAIQGAVFEEAEGSVVDVREDLGDELAVVINHSFAVFFDF